MPSQGQKQITILGAGVSGLQTALSLRTSPLTSHHRVVIIASHLPGDLAPEYTSPWAGGHWRSHVGFSAEEERVRKWDKRTYESWYQLLSSSLHRIDESSDDAQYREKYFGLGFKDSRNFWGADTFETRNKDGSGIWWRDVVKNFRVLKPSEIDREGKEGAVFGIGYQSICINIPRYLEYLLEKVGELGVEVVKTDLDTTNGLSGVVRSAETNINLGESDAFALINCTGISARKFVGVEEAEKIFPIRGQTMLIQGEATHTQTYTSVPGIPGSELLYVVPRPSSGMTILGGCKQIGNWSSEIDIGLNERILDRVRRFNMIDGIEDDIKVLSTQVGFRPGRRGGPRVEIEREKVAGLWILHNYGHSGGGYQCSVGCAEEIVHLIDSLSR